MSDRSRPQKSAFDVQLREGPRSVVLVVRGELDLAAIPRLGAAIELAMRTGRPQVVVDLAAITFVDSSGVNALMQLHRRTLDGGATLLLLPGDEGVQRVFALMGLLTTLPFLT